MQVREKAVLVLEPFRVKFSSDLEESWIAGYLVGCGEQKAHWAKEFYEHILVFLPRRILNAILVSLRTFPQVYGANQHCLHKTVKLLLTHACSCASALPSFVD